MQTKEQGKLKLRVIEGGRSVRLAPDLWDKVEAYWHKMRLPSRTAAVRDLIEKGLKK